MLADGIRHAFGLHLTGAAVWPVSLFDGWGVLVDGMERGMGDLAVYDFKEAIKRDPDNSDYHISYVDLLITLKRKGEALDELDKLVKMGVHRGSLLDLYSRARKIK